MNMAEQAPLPDQEKQGHTYLAKHHPPRRGNLNRSSAFHAVTYSDRHTFAKPEAVHVYPLPSRFLFWLDGVPQFVYVSSHRLRDWDVTTDRLNVFEYREKEDA